MQFGSVAQHHRILDGSPGLDDTVRIAQETPHKEILGRLAKHPNYHIRRAVVVHGHKEHLDVLMHDPHSYVRSEVASTTTHKKHFAHLMNDKNDDVRTLVAMYSPHKEHAMHMMHDENGEVGGALARRHPETHDHLANHPDEFVRQQVAIHSDGRHLDKLKNDPDKDVRTAVASRAVITGQAHLHHHLMNDPHPHVRVAVAANTKDKDIATHLTRDENQAVVTQAKKNLHINHGDKSMLESFAEFTKTV